jgi:hypothetical protein
MIFVLMGPFSWQLAVPSSVFRRQPDGTSERVDGGRADMAIRLPGAASGALAYPPRSQDLAWVMVLPASRYP